VAAVFFESHLVCAQLASSPCSFVRETAGQQYSVSIPGIDGNPSDVALPARGWQVALFLCCGSCFPCCIPPLFSAEKKAQYLNLIKSFSFIISLIQVIVFIVEISVGGVVSWADNPSLGPSAATLVDLGAKQAHLMRYDGQVWRFVTPIFLHAGFIHIIFNLLFQLRFGLIAERRWGTLRFAILYFIAGVAGNLMSCLIYYNSVSVGASTALMGVVGAYCTELLLRWKKLDEAVRRTTVYPTIFMALVVTLFSFWGSSLIDGPGHLGGFIAGVLVGGLYFSDEIENLWWRKAVPITSSILLAVYFALGFGLFYSVVPV
jgi:rhomboid protease GluP